MRKLISIATPAAIALAIALAIGATASGGSPGTAKVNFAPVADSYVKSKPANENYGDHKHLHVDAGPVVERSYIRFNLRGLTGSVRHAWLMIEPEKDAAGGFDVRAVGDSSWREDAITWANAPSPGAFVAWSGKLQDESYTKIDVTPLVKGNGLVSMALTAPSGQRSLADNPGKGDNNNGKGDDKNDQPSIKLESRENDDAPPYLVVETSTNAPPVAQDDTASTNEDTPLVLPDAVVLANDSDADGNPLSVTSVSATATTHGTVSHSGAQITYSPAPNYNGAADFRYSISDGVGGTASALVHVTVTPVNDPPVASDGAASGTEGSATTITLNASDVDAGTTLAFSIVDAPAHGTLGPVSGNTVAYTPDPGYSGPDSFTFKANDGSLDSNAATISLTDTNLPPVASAGSAAATEGSATTISLVATDPGAEPLTFSVVASPAHGILGPVSGNTVAYTPNPGYSGPDSFTFKANDGSLDSNVATISLTDTNLPPVASDVSAGTPGGTTKTITLVASDPGGESLTFSIVGAPAHGSLGPISGSSVDYTPNAGFVGTDSFTYRASDGSLGSNVATVTVNVVDRPPTANDDNASADSNNPLSLSSSALTANDTDPDSDPLTVTGVTPTGDTHGSVTLAGGTITYTPDPSYGGAASFQYTIGDGHGGTSAATVHVTVDYQPGAPIRAAFYYPWFPEAWTQSVSPFTQYTPSLGYYTSTAATGQHIAAMQYGHIQVGISSWWGVGDKSDVRLPGLLAAAAGTNFRWATYYEQEGQGNPSVTQIESDLSYIGSNYGSNPGYERIGGHFVVFVYNEPADDCTMADRWKQANDALGDPAYIVLKVVAGFRGCAGQPDGWHQYAPDQAENSVLPWSFAVSPGFYKATESAPRLYRDSGRFRQNIQHMLASGATFDLVETFNEWGEGTAVENALQWESNSGYGEYLDALHDDGAAVTGDPVVLAAGDIASSRPDDEKTADLLQLYPSATVFTLGDNAYEQGLTSEFNAYYTPSWGRPNILSRTHPSVGNHEYSLLADAANYFTYFGSSAGTKGQGWYSFDLGGWHIVVLNSNCSRIGGCGAGSAQDTWLKADLASHPAMCTLAYWHHPRFSSGVTHGSNAAMGQFWQDLYNAGADVVLNGHEHNYERFAPQTPGAVADPARGIREFVSGTGGKDGDTYTLGPRIANSEASNDKSLGVLKLILHPGGYDWRFLPEGGDTFTDSGSGTCHA